LQQFINKLFIMIPDFTYYIKFFFVHIARHEFSCSPIKLTNHSPKQNTTDSSHNNNQAYIYYGFFCSQNTSNNKHIW